jgi:hypothetical protein
MVRNRYAKGRRNEWKSMEYLETHGLTCFRTAGSHSDWDIIALSPTSGRVMLVQVKTNKKPRIDPTKTWCGVHPDHLLILHVWYDYAKEPEHWNLRTGDMLMGFKDQ